MYHKAVLFCLKSVGALNVGMVASWCSREIMHGFTIKL